MAFLSLFGVSVDGEAVLVCCESVAGGAVVVVFVVVAGALRVADVDDEVELDVVLELSRRARSRGIDGVVLPTVSVTIGAFPVDMCTGADEVRPPVACAVEAPDVGSVPAIAGEAGTAEPLPVGFGFVGSVKFDVVSTFVLVSGGVVPPGPSMVDVTLLAEPS